MLLTSNLKSCAQWAVNVDILRWWNDMIWGALERKQKGKTQILRSSHSKMIGIEDQQLTRVTKILQHCLINNMMASNEVTGEQKH